MRKRSRHRPRPVLSDPLMLLRPAPQADRDVLMLRFLSALDSMANGKHPGVSEWRDLSDAINTVETLALTLRKLVPAEVMPTVNAAIAAMVAASERFKAGNGMRLDGPGLQALRDVVAIYGQCLETLTGHEMAVACAETSRRIAQQLRQHEAASGTLVVAL